MKKWNITKKLLCVGLTSLLALSLAACQGQAEVPGSTPPTASVQPTADPTPTSPPIPFTDVPEDSYYYDAVVWAYENGVTSGDTLFEPLSTCTRGQVITFLWRAMGSPEPQITENPVSDIAPSNWYYKPVLWAYESGISTSSAFKPNSPCTNGEALTFLWRAEGKPMAAVSSSTVALAASGAYYERPAAWADSNGLFAQMGAAFDPSAPCSRAYLMSYLYWAEEQWTSATETKALQAEYEQIIQDAKPYEVFGSGLCYADYVDVDGDGTVELLTLELYDNGFQTTAALYASADGHAKKSGEITFETSAGKMSAVSICKADGDLYLRSAGYSGYGLGHDSSDLYIKIECGALTRGDDLYEEEDYDPDSDTVKNTYRVSGRSVSQYEYESVLQKYSDDKDIFRLDFGYLYIEDRGLVSTPKIQINGTTVKLSADPYLSDEDNEYMVPLRDVLEAMGVAVYANSDASVILASTKSDTLAITRKFFSGHGFGDINSEYNDFYDNTYRYSMNGGEFKEVAIEFANGKAYLPLQTIVSLFGATAEWDGKAGAMQITSNIPDSSRMTQDELKKMANFDLDQALKVAASQGYKENQGYGNNTGYKVTYFWANDGSAYGVTFKNGKAIWVGYVEASSWIYEYWDGEIVGAKVEVYPIEVASDGTITTYPNDRSYHYSSQI